MKHGAIPTQINEDITATYAVTVDRRTGRVKVSEIFVEYFFDAALVATLAICIFI